MSMLPRLSGREVVSHWQDSGMRKIVKSGATLCFGSPRTRSRLVVPDHKEIAKGTLRAIIKQAGLTVEEFNALF